MKQLVERLSTAMLAIIVAVSLVPTGAVAHADKASGEIAASFQAVDVSQLAPDVVAETPGLRAQSLLDAGKLSVDGNSRVYSSESEIVNAISKLEGKTFVVTMYRDWTGCRLVIPKKAKATLNMQGNMINRNLASYKSKGEVVRMEEGSTLIANGGDFNDKHNVAVFESTNPDRGRTGIKTITGGVFCGGYTSSNGGGIYLNKGKKTTVTNVAGQNWTRD